MKLNIANPATGCQKQIKVDDEHALRAFYDKRIATEVPADSLGDEWKGYVLRITGGSDKEGFPMKQGVLSAGRVRLLMKEGTKCYRALRKGERKRKSVRGCIVDQNLSVLNLIVSRKGEHEIPGLTDTSVPRRLGPKRASRIRKLFNLSKADDVRAYVVRRALAVKTRKDGKERLSKTGKPRSKAPRIQRLVTPITLQRKRHRRALKKRRVLKKREEAAEYAKLLAMRLKEARDRKESRKRSRSRLSESQSQKGDEHEPAAKSAKTATKKPAAAEKPKQADKAAKTAKTAKPTDKAAPTKQKAAGGDAKKPRTEAAAAGKKPEAAKASATSAAAKQPAKAAQSAASPKAQPAAAAAPKAAAAKPAASSAPAASAPKAAAKPAEAKPKAPAKSAGDQKAKK